MPKGVPNKENFVGKRFGEKGQLEILEWCGEIYTPPNSRGGDRLYFAKCHECAQDTELHGEAIYKVTRSNINAGWLPCGCAKSPRHTEEQYKVLAARVCKEKNYELIDIPWSTTKNRASSYVHYKCNNCGTLNSTTILTNFVRGTGCKRCAEIAIGANNEKPDSEMIATFASTGSFAEGTLFKRSAKRSKNGVTRLWDVTCPICANDEYVLAGLCTGVFSVMGCSLVDGALPCRCATNHIFTTEQREYQISKILKDEPKYSFMGWVDGFKNTKSYMTIDCSEHGPWTLRLNNFVSSNATRCPGCSGSGGFDKNDKAVVYILRIVGEDCKFTGYGISNTPEKRLADHKRSLKPYNLEITETTTIDMQGTHAAQIESLIKKNFPWSKQQPEGFRREATNFEMYEDVVDFVEKTLFEIAD